jgi:4-amino-4-deoxy-L-arabinose transferase-like glycosyltransferase
MDNHSTEAQSVPLNRQNTSRWLLVATALSCLSQLFWFGSKCLHQIDIDGMDYTGIARHLRNFQFFSAINDFRSPLLSWMIAAGSFLNGDFVRVGKVLNAVSFLSCVVLLYFFTKSLWRSSLAASLAAFWFSLCRGLTAEAVQMVTPDLLLAALTLAYFMVLLQCLRTSEKKYWVLLGAVHGLAFLAKGIALPWLALCTLFAVTLSTPAKRWAVHLALAGILPLLVATGWAGVLHPKYAVFTSGTQFKANFLQWTVRAYDNPPDRTYAVLNDTKPYIDEYGVNDPMPPGSWPWRFRIEWRQAIPKSAASEARNLPKAMKEFLIVVTPGGLLAFALVLAVLNGRRLQTPVEFTVAIVVTLGAISLLLAYCMLVFDGRYLYPVIPLVLAVAVGLFFLDQRSLAVRRMSGVAGTLIILGVIASFVYSSSPFRKLDRDFQVSCYRAGQILRGQPGTAVVTVGLGPYQEHGVGWEAGYKSAYFGNRRLIGAIDKLPTPEETTTLLHDISSAAPDAILVWGRPEDEDYQAFVRLLLEQYDGSSKESIADPILGEVGTAIFAPIRKTSSRVTSVGCRPLEEPFRNSSVTWNPSVFHQMDGN